MLGRASLAQDDFSGAHNIGGFFSREPPALEEQLPLWGNSMMRLVSCVWEEGGMIWVVSTVHRDGTESVLCRCDRYSPFVIVPSQFSQFLEFYMLLTYNHFL